MADEIEIINPTYSPTVAPVSAPAGSGALDTLDNKKLAILFNGWPTWQLLLDRFVERLKAKYPSVEVKQYLVPIGSAAPRTVLDEVAEQHDVALVGLGNCGSCTAWSYYDSAELFKAGVPTVWAITNEFESLANSIRKLDLPVLMLPKNPELIEQDSALELMNDEVADGLIQKLLESDPSLGVVRSDGNGVGLNADVDDRPRDEPRATVPADLDAAFEEMYDRGWTDGLPVIPPTPARVERMLRGLGEDVDPKTVVGEIPPRYGVATYESLAATAVMAGCSPDYMPLLVTMARIACVQELNLNGMATTTGSTAPVTIVNGPVRNELGFNTGRGFFGPGWRSNATIGRFMRLMLLNIGGAVPAVVSKSIMGTPGRYSLCIAEREEDSSWEPLHVTRGLPADASALTVMGAMSTVSVMTRHEWKGMLTSFGDSLAVIGSNNVMMGRGYVLVVLSPGQAKIFAEAGLSKADVAEGIWNEAAVPKSRFPDSVRPQSPNKWIEDGDLVRVVPTPEHLFLMVAGGPEATYGCVLPSHPSVVPITSEISAQ